jgi:hypothetical protein
MRWNLWPLFPYVVGPLLFFLAYSAFAEGQVVSQADQIPDCPYGQVLLIVSVGPQTIAQVCMSRAELERADYRSLIGTDKGQIVCRTLIVKK